ncbi:hypothetical protein BH769_gp46 [Gordonia phage BritBrat]|uniref:Uncharacterized protein n=1 Tax=Gordonia phage BritBrat TaxID=1838064 RepID=A0A160DEU8_9CAUD|nr:hypothetical protein BH769_gp46 [Gordonia phage BritBrat]ANA85304.1 hypothetical protein PBI_BRITBRAT_46 [Gordonia phage BritBrat]
MRYVDKLMLILAQATPTSLAEGESVVIVLQHERDELAFTTQPYPTRDKAHSAQSRCGASGRAYVASRHNNGITYLTDRSYILGTLKAEDSP